ncbi:MAG: carbon-phosphorus lyase complex subunit PhnI, partial [Euryarchaeota archaeon]|nr:carbon-phosphorus lyase complex subunit PhnI [Euryarchaeota archaeon]
MLVKGGSEAIKNAGKLVGSLRSAPSPEVSQIRGRLRLSVDQVMGEGGLYAPELAALAIRQSDGDLVAASFLIRAYRSTLPRIGYSEISDTRDMFVLRRISSAFKEIPGGQILGPSIDYTERLLDFEERDMVDDADADADQEFGSEKSDIPKFKKMSDLLRDNGLLEDVSADDENSNNARDEPYDIT